MKIRVFNSLPKDAVDIRQAVFVDEQKFKEEFDENDKSAIHFVLYDGETAVATSRVLKEPNGVYHIGRIAVIKSRRGQGLGRMIVEAAENHARTLGGKSILIGAQTQAQGFYATLGYLAEGDIYYEEHCPHVRMTKSI